MSPAVAENPSPPASYADFSDAEKGGWLRTAVQFFAIPLLIVSVAVAIYVGANLMVGSGPSTAAEFVDLLQSDTINRRWQAAFELARRLQGAEVPAEFRDPRLTATLASALARARADAGDDARLACTILGIIGRLADPASVPAVREALDDPHPWIRSYAVRALGGLGDRESVPRLRELGLHEDPGTRQAALAVLAQLDAVAGVSERLAAETRALAMKHLSDPKEDVRFTAALVLARAGEAEAALPVLGKMLDRTYLEQFGMDATLTGISRYQLHSNLILRAIEAVDRLDARNDEAVTRVLRQRALAEHEGDQQVRSAAQKVLHAWESKD